MIEVPVVEIQVLQIFITGYRDLVEFRKSRFTLLSSLIKFESELRFGQVFMYHAWSVLVTASCMDVNKHAYAHTADIDTQTCVYTVALCIYVPMHFQLFQLFGELKRRRFEYWIFTSFFTLISNGEGLYDRTLIYPWFILFGIANM